VPALAFESAVRSEVGRRPNNEDAVFATGRLAVLADGVGGAVGGEVASRWIVNAFIHLDKSRLSRPLAEAMREALRWGNEAIAFIADCRPHLAGMGTTVTAAAMTNDGDVLLVNVGDSRTYLFRAGRLRQLTHDDTLVQTLVDSGAISAADARRHPHRSIVVDAIDGQPRQAPDVMSLRAVPGDRLLLCSDGLSDVIDDDEIATALQIQAPDDCARTLIDLALRAGSHDNISVIVADVSACADPGAGWLPGLV
jgi:PPM family protein phosphatase